MFVRWAGGFASSQLLKSRSGLAPGEEATINPQQDEGLKAELVCRAAAVRDIMGVASDRGIALREVLKGGVLAGQAVYFQSRHGPILNKGEPAVDVDEPSVISIIKCTSLHTEAALMKCAVDSA